MKNKADKKRLMGLTMGDPYGIGPEIIVKAINEENINDIVIVGDYQILQKSKELFAPELKLYPIKDLESMEINSSRVPVLDVGKTSKYNLDQGRLYGNCGPTVEGGCISVISIRYAVEMAMKNIIEAVITAPISKEAINKAGYYYSGHTEFLAELTGTQSFAMMLMAGHLRVILATTHCPISMVTELLSMERIFNILYLTHNWWIRFFGYSPKLAVAALNPHGGEGGLFGKEEEIFIKPAIENAKKEGIRVSGPYPSDTLFHYAKDGRYDAVLVMYHDQGLIPLKMYSFGRGVNCTIGLPIIRTSVDHGTAYDIAWKGKADPSSLKEAIKTARDLANRNVILE